MNGMGLFERECRVLRFADTELRAAEENGKRTLRGYAAVFDRDSEDLGGFVETIAPGAFAKALRRSDPIAAFNHDPSALLGRTSNGTLRLWEDDRGLGYTIELLENDPLSEAVVRRVERKDLTGSSFMFTVGPDGQQWTEDGKRMRRRVTEVHELFDVGPVTRPAYEATKVSARALELARAGADAATRARAAELIRLELEAVRLY